jgi:hypothetical protein
MKTPQIMIRELAGHSIRQNHKTLMFSANDMASLFPKKNLEHWIKSKSTIDFSDTIKMREELNDDDVILRTGIKRGNESGTWLHPLLAVDLAMWLDSNFKYDVLKWVQDHLCIARDNAGNTYKEMGNAIQTVFGNDCSPMIYVDECDMVQGLAGVRTAKRNQESIEKLDLLTKLERWNAKLLLKGVKNRNERRVRLIEFMEMDSIV